jgi:predicted nucleotidyltransferase
VLTIDQIKAAVQKVAPSYPVKSVQLFGSYAEGLATPDSDVDVLVEFSPRPVGLWDVFGFQNELSETLEIKVDIVHLPLSREAQEDLIIEKVVRLYD